VTAALQGAARVGLEADHISWSDQRRYADAWLPGAELVATSGLVEGLRPIAAAERAARAVGEMVAAAQDPRALEDAARRATPAWFPGDAALGSLRDLARANPESRAAAALLGVAALARGHSVAATASVINVLVLTAVGLEAPEHGDLVFGYAYPQFVAAHVAHLAGASNLGLRVGLAPSATLGPPMAWIVVGLGTLLRALRTSTSLEQVPA